MTDHKAIADRLVERGIVRVDAQNPDLYWTAPSGNHPWPPAHICHDWRVAGAIMEKAHMVFCEKHGRWQVRYDVACGNRTREWHGADSLPLAIILAYLDATDE